MATNLLSPEELSALAEGVTNGSIPVDTGFNMSASFKKHDLSSEDSSLGVNLASIDMVNERFLRMFRSKLMGALRSNPRIHPTKVEVIRFGDYLKTLQPPLSVNVVRMNPLRGNALIVIDTTLIFSSLDSFFGGFGKGTLGLLPPSRMFTATEMRIINMILDIMFASLEESWLPLMPLNFELVNSEINAQFAQISDENDLVILSRFETETATKNKGFLDIVYSYASLKPVRELLRSRVQSGDSNEDSDKQWRTELELAVGDACVPTNVFLGAIQTTLSTIEKMQADDVLYFKKPDLAILQTNGIPTFEVQVGQLGTQVAVQIERAVVPGKN